MWSKTKAICKALALQILRLLAIYGGVYLLMKLLFSKTIAIVSVVIVASTIAYVKAKLRQYGRQFENIYECSESPDDNRVYIRAWWHRKWLQWSGNKMDVTVHEIPYQYAEYCNENWEEYQDRKQAFIQNDRVIRHQDLEARKLKGDKYKVEALKQRLPHHLTKIFGA